MNREEEKEYEERLKKFSDLVLAKRANGEMMFQKNMCFLDGIDNSKEVLPPNPIQPK